MDKQNQVTIHTYMGKKNFKHTLHVRIINRLYAQFLAARNFKKIYIYIY